MLSIIFIGKGNPQEVFGKEFLPSAKKLIIVEPYGYTRNPMIFGWLLIMFGVGILLEKFGNDYVEYCETIPILMPCIFKSNKSIR